MVPPTFMGDLCGVYGVKITTRKVHLLDRNGESIESCFYRFVHQVGKLDFAGLVDFVRDTNRTTATEGA
jgi:hypothetical protein